MGAACVCSRNAVTPDRERSQRVDELLLREEEAGLCRADHYRGFQAEAERIKNDFLAFLIEARNQGKTVAAYGAAAKGNTLMNYAGVRPDLVAFVADRNPAKQGKYMPGSRVPITDEAHLRAVRPDYVVLLPWNLRAELVLQLDYIREWGGNFAIAIPRMELL